MKNQKAKRLNEYLEFWMNNCVHVLEVTEYANSYDSIDILKLKFQETNFNQMYDEFIEELKSNIVEYKNIEYVDNYIVGAFGVITDGVDNYEKGIDIDVVKNGFEVKFLLTVITAIDQAYNKVNTIYWGKGECKYSNELKSIFYEQMYFL